MSDYQLIHNLLDRAHRDLLENGYSCIKIFKGSEDWMYFYADSKGENPYTFKVLWTEHHYEPGNTFLDDLYQFLVKYTEDLPTIKVARLQKKANGVRIRLDENYAKQDGLDALAKLVRRAKLIANPPPPLAVSVWKPIPVKPEPTISVGPEPKTPVWKSAQYVATEKKGNNMGDFSLSNLKDALVDKITHLDRKTVMILSIIALLLLIAGKYNTIKDILSGIKNKVKNSDNFKAMVTDGTNAINSLKKIVGVKGKGDTDAKA